MNIMQNEEGNFPVDAPDEVSSGGVSKRSKISGLLSLAVAVLAIVSLFMPVFSAILFWNLLLCSAALAVFGFLEGNSKKNWISNISWIVSLASFVLLFFYAFDSFKNPQAPYFYGAFSIILPIFMVINGLIAKKSPVWKSLAPLIIPVLFIISMNTMNSRSPYFSLLLLPISWGLLGIVNYSGRN